MEVVSGHSKGGGHGDGAGRRRRRRLIAPDERSLRRARRCFASWSTETSSVTGGSRRERARNAHLLPRGANTYKQ